MTKIYLTKRFSKKKLFNEKELKNILTNNNYKKKVFL